MDRTPINHGSIANAASADRAIRIRANGQNDSALSSRTSVPRDKITLYNTRHDISHVLSENRYDRIKFSYKVPFP